MKKFLFYLCLSLLCISCVDEIRRPIASGSSEDNNSENLSIVNLPVQFISTNYLIHPVGEIEVRESEYSGSSSSVSGSFGFTRNSSLDTYSGNVLNLKFQQLESDSLTLLTEKNLKISSFSFLRSIFENTGKGYLLYRVIDSDTNDDGEMNHNDINTLYISSISGEDFRKISMQHQGLVDWKSISSMNRIYFRSIEDTNKNGEFGEDDELHYFYLYFDLEAVEMVEYFPV